MTKKIGTIIIYVLGVVLLAYSASRSLNFIKLTLPKDQAGLAYFGLAALDGGLVAWIISYMHGSRGWQRAISLLMALIDLIGVIAMFTLDTLYNTGAAGLTKAMDANQMQTAVIALSGIIGLNIAAAVAHHITEPEKLREQAEEEAFDKVESATMKQISKNAETLAAQLAPIMADDWMRQTQARYIAHIGTGKFPTILKSTMQDIAPNAETEAIKVQPVPLPVNHSNNGNGHK
jgi:hypothetical protein